MKTRVTIKEQDVNDLDDPPPSQEPKTFSLERDHGNQGIDEHRLSYSPIHGTNIDSLHINFSLSGAAILPKC